MRILAWTGNDARNATCKAWGQELDDDGCFPAALTLN